MTQLTTNDSPAADAPMTLLVVDDCDETRYVLVRMVEPLGLDIIETDNGAAALDILKRRPVDAVMSDLVMPRMTGMGLLSAMTEQGFTMPFVLVTGYDDKDAAIQALRIGAFDYVEKPVETDELQAAIGEALKVSTEHRRMRATPPPAQSWSERRDELVAKAVPQLVICEGRLMGLSSPDALASRELGAVMRAVRSVRQTAEAIRVDDLASFARTNEAALAAAKVVCKKPGQEEIAILLEGLRLLRGKLEALTDPGMKRAAERLESMTEQLRGGFPKAS